jgi:hypothetical protein
VTRRRSIDALDLMGFGLALATLLMAAGWAIAVVRFCL